MIFNKSFLLVTALLTGALAECGTPEVTCETSDGSPNFDDANTAMGYWRELQSNTADSCGDAGCAQPYGSGCHDQGGTFKTAQIVLCQDDSSASNAECADCTCVAGYLQAVLDQCESNGKVGGYAHVDRGGNYINFEFVHT